MKTDIKEFAKLLTADNLTDVQKNVILDAIEEIVALKEQIAKLAPLTITKDVKVPNWDGPKTPIFPMEGAPVIDPNRTGITWTNNDVITVTKSDLFTATKKVQ